MSPYADLRFNDEGVMTTGIECASNVGSFNGLMVHVFGKLAAAMFYWNFLRVST